MFDLDNLLQNLHHFLYRNLRGYVSEGQYVGTVRMSEDEFEENVLEGTLGSWYNPLAYWKYHKTDKRDSVGSWKITHRSHPEYVEPGMQLHITLFKARVNDEWIDVYAHYEYDWLYAPIKHIREVHFSEQEGVRRMRKLLNDNEIDFYHTH